MIYKNVYFINGNAYAGKSTMVKLLAEKFHGIACEENYHDIRLNTLKKEDFPALSYTKELKDWHDFVRRTPDEYEKWIIDVTKECEIIELQILEELVANNKDQLIFVDTNISLETLHKISDVDHVLIMLTDNETSVNRFFERPDKEKQFLYKLLLEEEDPEYAIENFKQCLKRINSPEAYNKFLNSGFNVLHKDESRDINDTLKIVESFFKLNS